MTSLGIREQVLLRINSCQTLADWMEITGNFSISVIHQIFLVLHDEKELETLSCKICHWYRQAVEEYDISSRETRWFMKLPHGHQRDVMPPASLLIILKDFSQQITHPEYFPVTDSFRSLLSGADNAPLPPDNGRTALPPAQKEAEAKEEEESLHLVSNKVLYAGFISLLNYFGIGTKKNDLSKIVRFFCAFTGKGQSSIYKMAQNHFRIHTRQKDDVDLLNKAFADLKLPIRLDYDTVY